MKIEVAQYTKHGFSDLDAKALYPIIAQAIASGEDKIELDFLNVEFFTTTFFGGTVTQALSVVGVEDYQQRFCVSNLSESGKFVYDTIITAAMEYYSTHLKK